MRGKKRAPMLGHMRQFLNAADFCLAIDVANTFMSTSSPRRAPQTEVLRFPSTEASQVTRPRPHSGGCFLVAPVIGLVNGIPTPNRTPDLRERT